MPASFPAPADDPRRAPSAAGRAIPAWPVNADADTVIVPWGVSLSERCRQALPALDAERLPNLSRLLTRLTEAEWLRGDEYDPAPPHERWLAHAAGWPDPAQSPSPWAALWAKQDGLPLAPDQPWGLLTPCHWLMGRDHLTLLHPDELALGEAESRALFDTVRPLFDSEGWQLHWAAPARWYASHPTLAGLPTASLDRVVGRNPDLWMPDHPQARLIRRLQSEVQMVLYQHPVNDEREARGALTVNSFWLSGCGAAAPLPARWPARVLDEPRQALLREDTEGWLDAWQRLDRDELARVLSTLDAGRTLRLTLCGERHAVTLHAPAAPPSPWAALGRRLRQLAGQAPSPAPAALLAEL